MSLYIDTEDLKATLGISNTDFTDDDLDRAAPAASGIVDAITGRTFDKDNADSTRYFAPEDLTLLRIDDMVTLTSVAIDRDNDGTYEETWVEGTDFRKGPPNAAAKSEPFTWLEAINGQTFRTSGGYVKIVGKFGWPSVPAEIVQATGIIASKLLRRSREAPFAVVFDASGGSSFIGRNDPEVRALLARFVIKPAIGSPRLG